jgi:hypothetical protein
MLGSKLGGLGLLAFLAAMWTGACAGKTNGLGEKPRGGSAGSAGESALDTAGQAGALGTAGQAGALGTAGQAGAPGTAGQASAPETPVERVSGEGKLEIPPPPDDSCRRFNVTVGDCANSDCLSPWPCPAALPFGHEAGTDWWWCATSTYGRCIISFDCAAAEAAEKTHDLINCLGDQYPCLVDADCAPANVDPIVEVRRPYCVIDAHYPSGDCKGGRMGDPCREHDDCLPGNRCIAISEDGKRACTDGIDAHGSPCNVDADCHNQRCFHASTSLAVGLCSSGKPGAPCLIDNGICLGDSRCIPVESSGLGPDGRMCSSGNVGDPCYLDSDCKSHHCPTGRDSVCIEGVPGEACFEAADCADGFCGPASRVEPGKHCTTGAVGEPCATEADCKSKRCVPNGFTDLYAASCGP